MRIDTLQLEQFRSYDEEVIDLKNGDIYLFVGANGAGKTNILEALSVLSIGKSCISNDERDLVMWDRDYYRVRAEARTDDGQEKQLEITSQVIPRKQKACFINDVRMPVSQMVGTLPVVIFLPQDLHLFTGPPLRRRAFLDDLLSQVSPEYTQLHSEYQKILKQRNSLLKKIADGVVGTKDLTVWNEKLSGHAAKITLSRLELIKVLQCTIAEELVALGESWEEIKIVYERKSVTTEEESLREEIKDLLEHYQERDIILQSTTVGPHRDDWHIEIGERELTTFASRGQQRVAVLALLFLEVSYLELRRGEKPVILLDDVFSELDDAHQGALLKSLTGHQVIITSTHVPSKIHGATVYDVTSGTIQKKAIAVA